VGHSRVRLKSLLGSLDLNEAWRREVGTSRECLKVFALCIECPNELERRGGPFIAPQENLAVGVSKTRTCPGRGPDMSGKCLWNPATEPDKAERLDMYGLVAGHLRLESLESGYEVGYVWPDRSFWW
jgi:hypothetical protein